MRVSVRFGSARHNLARSPISTDSSKAVVFGTIAAVLCGLSAACASKTVGLDQPIAEYRDRMLIANARDADTRRAERAVGGRRNQLETPTIQLVGSAQQETRRTSLLTEPADQSQPVPEDVLAQIPDPSHARETWRQRLEDLKRTAREARIVNKYQRVIDKAEEYLEQLEWPQKKPLSLLECIERALAHNYTIRADAYSPAISRAQLVQAEAAFDAIFFLDFTYNNIDRPTASQLAGNQTDLRTYTGGFRQLLPTGMQVETSLSQTRTFTDLQFQTLNPAYDTTFTASFTQPVLRGFGLDVNRAQINIRRADLRISREQFIQSVRDTILNVEQAYWQLVRARRDAAINALTVAQNYETFQSMKQRQDHDATPVELANSESRFRTREVQFFETIRVLRDAEDQLKNLLNDPDLLLSSEIELVPTETPLTMPMAVDHFAEMRMALDERSEIREARERIEQARIQTAVAKNDTLPQLDVALRYTVQGLDQNSGNSFDSATTNRFRSYAVTVNFSYPIGNRSRRAAWIVARRQESQAIVRLQQVMDGIVQEVNNAVRQLMFRYKQLPPQLIAVEAAVRNLRALQARSQAITPAFLETELSNIEQLAQTRRTLLQIVTDYNSAIVGLEQVKGTLLEYNSIVVADGSRAE